MGIEVPRFARLDGGTHVRDDTAPVLDVVRNAAERDDVGGALRRIAKNGGVAERDHDFRRVAVEDRVGDDDALVPLHGSVAVEHDAPSLCLKHHLVRLIARCRRVLPVE